MYVIFGKYITKITCIGASQMMNARRETEAALASVYFVPYNKIDGEILFDFWDSYYGI